MGIKEQSLAIKSYSESLSYFIESDSSFKHAHKSNFPFNCTSLAFAVFDPFLHTVSPTQYLRSTRIYKNIFASHNTPVEISLYFEFDGVEVNYSFTKNDPSRILTEQLNVDGKTVFEYDCASGMITKLEIAGTENLRRDLSSNKHIHPLSYVFNNSVIRDSKEEIAYTKTYQWIKGLALLSPYSESNSIRNAYCSETQTYLKTIYLKTKGDREGLSDFLYEFKNISKEKIGHKVRVVSDGCYDLIVENPSHLSCSGFMLLTDKNIYLVRLYSMLVDPNIKTIILDDVKRAFNDNSDLITILDRVVAEKFPDKNIIFIS